MPNTTPPQPQPQIPASPARRKPTAAHVNAAPRAAQEAHGKTALGAAQVASTNPKPAAPTRLHPPVQKTGRTMDFATTGVQSQRVAALNARLAQKRAAANPAQARPARKITPPAAQPKVASQVRQNIPRVQQHASQVRRNLAPQAKQNSTHRRPASRPITAQQPEVELGIIEEYYAATITTEPAQPTSSEPVTSKAASKTATKPVSKTTSKTASQPVAESKPTAKGQLPEQPASPAPAPKRPNWPFLSSIQVDKRPLSGARPATKTPVSAPVAPQPAVSSVVLNSISTGKRSKAPFIILLIITILLGIAAGAAVYFCIFGI